VCLSRAAWEYKRQTAALRLAARTRRWLLPYASLYVALTKRRAMKAIKWDYG
jgi:hypothetical protein